MEQTENPAPVSFPGCSPITRELVSEIARLSVLVAQYEQRLAQADAALQAVPPVGGLVMEPKAS